MVVLVALALAAVDQEVSSGHEMVMIMKVSVMGLTITVVVVEDYLHQTFSAPPIENYQIVVVAVVELSAVVVVVRILVESFQSVS